jgi:hypothetical protein
MAPASDTSSVSYVPSMSEPDLDRGSGLLSPTLCSKEQIQTFISWPQEGQSPSPQQTISTTRQALEVIASATKQTFSARMTSSPPTSPKKKKLQPQCTSAIRSALQGTSGQKTGLLQFFKKCTPEEHQAQVQRFTLESKDLQCDRKDKEAEIAERRAEHKREVIKLQQQKHHQKIYDAEIVRGERMPGGSKCKVK